RDDDLFTVKPDEPVTFIISNYEELSDVVVFYDFEPLEFDDDSDNDLEISDEGVFAIPAELVHDDFVVSVKARINDKDAESDELYITAE
ncbi:MAG: hypothetical protein IJR35_10445, partial [Synergistaceae bacterium]|nr:hypothetical protein [Synergistaceae bacterium]